MEWGTKMKLVSFNAMRTYDIERAHYIKPDNLFKEKDLIKESDWILFPEYWQVNTLVYGLKKRIFPNISTYHLGHNKIEMTRAFMSVCPANIPYTEILANTSSNREQILDTFSFPFIAKEVKNSMGRGVYLINSVKDFNDYCTANDVLYVQEKLPIDRDLRITYVGNNIVGAYWRIGAEDSFKNNVAQGGTVSYENIPSKALDLVKSLAQELDINHAGFDIAEVDGHFYVLEFNVMFGTKGLLDKKVPINRIILEYLHNQSPITPKDPLQPFPKVS